jgi:hypothetical protein
MWLSSFIACSFGNIVLKSVGFDYRKSGDLVSTIFQMNFLYNTSVLIFNNVFYNVSSQEATLLNLQELYGYFIYDITVILFSENPEKLRLYLIHHTITLLSIDAISTHDLGGSSNLYLNLVCFAAELPSPLINTRIFFDNKRLLSPVYFFSRIVLFPIASFMFLINFNTSSFTFNVLTVSISSIYISTIFWYSKLIKN